MVLEMVGSLIQVKLAVSVVGDWLAEPSLAATARLRPLGFGAAAFSRFASEGWWGKKLY